MAAHRPTRRSFLAWLALTGLALPTTPAQADVFYRQPPPAAQPAKPGGRPPVTRPPVTRPAAAKIGVASAAAATPRPTLGARPAQGPSPSAAPPAAPAIMAWIGAPALEPDGDALVIPFRGSAPACSLRRTSASWLELDCPGAGLDGMAPRKGSLGGPVFGTWFTEARTGHASLSLKVPPGTRARAEVRRTMGVIRVAAIGVPAPAPAPDQAPRPAVGRVVGVRPAPAEGGLTIGFQGADPVYEVSFQGPRLVVVTFPAAPPIPPGRWAGDGPLGPITGWSVTPTADGLGTRVALELRDPKDAIVVSERPGGGLLVSGPLPAGAPGQ